MAEEISFTQLDPFKLTGVIVTSKALGHGSYATVLELEYMGLKCAGKKIHDVLLRQGALSYPVKRFERECQLLSQIRHPNIVQFLGLCVQSNEEVPILVMEFLPTNLTSCIEKHGVMPQQISYSILHDVALGLCYLHSQTPPIIHRDLSSNNVLLTREMTAKISDLGVARILNLTPLQVSHMTQTPGTPAFMPPEVMVANPKYDTNIDEFSYGILMIHVLSGRWPEPQVGPTQSENGKLIPVSEAKRRDMFLQIIGRDHPLMSLIMKCIDNDQGQRSHANMIVNKMKKMVAQFPTILQNQLQMQKLIEISEEDKRALTEVVQMRAEIIKRKEEEIENLTNHLQKTLESQNSEKERTKLAHSIEVEALQVQLQHLKSDLRASNAEKAVVYTENITMENKLSEQLKKLITLQADNETLRSANRRLEEQAALREARMRRFNEEIMIKKELILSREATIATVSEQLSKAREYLVTKKQVTIAWYQCTDLPFATAAGQSTVINGKVYFGGGTTDDDNKRYLIHCYSPAENQWTTLPPLPVKYFGLGQINRKLVAVGGVNYKDKKKRTDVYVLDSHKWKSTIIPPMSLARTFPAVSSLSKLLIVAGGTMEGGCNTKVVEVFQQATSQWHLAATLPKACCNLSLVTSGDSLYALGGYDQPFQLNQVLYTSIDNLSRVHDPTKPTWRTLQSSSLYQPAPVLLSGNLLAIGGWQVPEGEVAQRGIHIYSSTTDSWVYFSDLPEPCAWTTCAVLSITEILLIGGRNEDKLRTVYKGTLAMKA